MNLYLIGIAILVLIFSISYITHKITKYLLYSIVILFIIFFIIGFSKVSTKITSKMMINKYYFILIVYIYLVLFEEFVIFVVVHDSFLSLILFLAL